MRLGVVNHGRGGVLRQSAVFHALHFGKREMAEQASVLAAGPFPDDREQAGGQAGAVERDKVSGYGVLDEGCDLAQVAHRESAVECAGRRSSIFRTPTAL